jgi:hypothetical protein
MGWSAVTGVGTQLSLLLAIEVLQHLAAIPTKPTYDTAIISVELFAPDPMGGGDWRFASEEPEGVQRTES